MVKMLNLNKDPPPSASTTLSSFMTTTSAGPPSTPHHQLPDDFVAWKVLIYDSAGQRIISPLMNVAELRTHGVTVHMSINSDRKPIPDVPAVYFVSPTQENIQKISQDFARGLYDVYYFNFTHTLPRRLLEELAQAAASVSPPPVIAQVYDQYLNFTTLDPNLFTLNIPKTHYRINDPSSTEEVINDVVNRVVDGLFSVLVTMNVVPVLSYQVNTSCEMIAIKLTTRLRDYYLGSGGGSNSAAAANGAAVSGGRPVLILVDRNIDIASMVMHTWHYTSMVQDVLGLKDNRLALLTDGKKKMYDIDPNDFFWKKNYFEPFPHVAEEVNNELKSYRKEVEDLTASCGVTSLEEVMTDTDNTKNLAVAITQLPALTERKRTIDMHMNMAVSLMNTVKERSLDEFHGIEENIRKKPKADILALLRDPAKSVDDKIRLFIVYYMSLTDDEVDQGKDEIVASVQEWSGGGIWFDYIKSHRKFNKMATSVTQQSSQSSSTSGTAAGNLIGNLTSRFTDSLNVSNIENIITNVTSRFTPSTAMLPIVKYAHKVMQGNSTTDGKSIAANADIKYIDPKLKTSGTNAKMTAFESGIVLVVGGGNYEECVCVKEYAEKSGHKIMYGATDVINAKDFIAELSDLGTVMAK